MNAAAAGLVLSLAAFAACVLASTCFAWHPALTGPGAALSAVALTACAVWLNRSAGGSDSEEENGYHDQMSRLHGATLPRARFILDQQQATLPGTPYNQGCIRATAGYIRALEASHHEEGQP
jgi:hypothetical protein